MLENNAAVRMDAGLVPSSIQLPGVAAVVLPIAAGNLLFFHYRGRVPIEGSARAAFLFQILQCSSASLGFPPPQKRSTLTAGVRLKSASAHAWISYTTAQIK